MSVALSGRTCILPAVQVCVCGSSSSKSVSSGRTGHLITLCQVSNSCFPSSSPATASASPVNMPTFGAPEQLLGLKQAGLETELLRARGSGVSPLSWL